MAKYDGVVSGSPIVANGADADLWESVVIETIGPIHDPGFTGPTIIRLSWRTVCTFMSKVLTSLSTRRPPMKVVLARGPLARLKPLSSTTLAMIALWSASPLRASRCAYLSTRV